SGKALRRFEGGFGEVVFSPDGRTLAAPDLEVVRRWDTTTGKPLATLPWPHRRPPSHVRFSLDGKYLAGGGSGPAITVWELATGKVVSPMPAQRDPIRAIALTPDRRILASVGSGDGEQATVTLWNVATGRELRRLDSALGGASAVLFSAGGGEVIAGPGS